MDRLTREAFVRHLREALNHLQDPDYLRRSPLASLFGVADRFDTFSAMQSTLIETIESLEPAADEPPQSRSWRIYESLLYRYVRQLGQQEVADQLGISARQVRREQRAALETLADLLWERFDLGARLGEAGVAGASGQAMTASAAVDEELAWLKNALPERCTDLEQTLSDLLDLVRPLAERYEVRLETRIARGLPDVAAHPVALNQILLNLLGVAFHQAAGSQVTISARPLRWEIEIKIWGGKAALASPSISDEDTASLNLTRHLVSLCNGGLTLSEDECIFSATLTFMALEQLPVLAIDDNADALELLRRYTSDTRYRLIGVRDPEQALVLAHEVAPQIILLDVMMPQMDGWKVLRRLRQHPLTSHIPVIVSTILAQEELALSLGASAFLRKPFTRQAILAVLDQEVERMGTESH